VASCEGGPDIFIRSTRPYEIFTVTTCARFGTQFNELYLAPHGFRVVIVDSEGNRIALHSSG
jgi:hypothetical protein